MTSSLDGLQVFSLPALTPGEIHVTTLHIPYERSEVPTTTSLELSDQKMCRHFHAFGSKSFAESSV